MLQIIANVLTDALLDSLKILPFLLACHILIEVYEYRAGSKIKVNKLLGGKGAPLLGSAVGLIPQCGFSVVATKLYAKRNIKLGTLLAVYIATSDEAIPILIASPSTAIKLVPLILIKFFLALAVGYGVNLFLRKTQTVALSGDSADEISTGCHHHKIGGDGAETHAHEHGERKEEVCEREHGEKEHGHKPKKFDWHRFVLHPLVHSLTTLAFIFGVNVILGGVLEFVGEDRLFAAMDKAVWAQPLIAALVGLIPNCASSVVITQMYAVGGLSLGAAVAGLSVNAGIALAVLFKENKSVKNNLLILLTLYAVGALAGIIITAVI